MDWLEFLKYMGQVGGIGAIFAMVMFWIYRQDRKDSEKRLAGIILDYNEACRQHKEATEKQRDATEKQTLMIRELTVWLQGRNGNHRSKDE